MAVKSFSNKNGRYVLYSDGSIVDPTGSRISEDPNNRWPYAPDYALPKRVRGKSLGSPWVAVDVVQDNNGTHVLYADGSIRTPNDTKVKERNVGEMQSYTLFIDGNGQSYHKGMAVNGTAFTFETPFREEPTFFLVDTLGVDNSNFYGTGHPAASSRAVVTKGSFTLKGRLGNILCTILGVADT